MKAHISFDTIANLRVKLRLDQFEKIIEGLGLSLLFGLLTHQEGKLLQSISKISVKFFDFLCGYFNAVNFYIKDLILDFLHKENRWECLINFIDRYDGILVIFKFIPVIMCSSFHTSTSSSLIYLTNLDLFLLLLVFCVIFHNIFPKLCRI